MCYSPITIKNRTLSFNPDYDPVLFQVPCGRCGECRRQMQNAYLIRSYYEWKACEDYGGKTFVVTFTYNDSHLPHFTLNGKTYPCFSKKDFQKFIDLFRKHMYRRFYVDKSSIKYFWVSEYGGTTHRPHYHAIINIYDKDLPASVIRHEITQDWPHGFVYFGKNGGVVYSYTACQYVAKYISKDLDFFGYVNKDDLKILKLYDYERYKMYKRKYFPFHTCSQEYGTAITSYVSPVQLYAGLVPMPTKKGYKVFPIPQYIDRKLYYYVDYDTNSYRLTREGVDMKIFRHQTYSLEKISETRSLMENICNYLDTCAIQDICKLTNIPYTRDDIKAIYKKFLSDYGVETYIDYMENRYFFKEDIREYDQVFIEPPSYEKRISKCFHTDRSSDYGQLLKGHSDLKNQLFCSNYPQLERFCELHDVIRYVIGNYKEIEYQQLYKQYSLTKKAKDIYGYH